MIELIGIVRLRLNRHRFPAQIISHSVWLYFRFALSFRDVEEMLAMRDVSVTYETVRQWCLKFGRTYANILRHRSSSPGDRWHLDEVLLKINLRVHYLWHALDRMETGWISWSKVREIRERPRNSSQVIKRFALCSECDLY